MPAAAWCAFPRGPPSATAPWYRWPASAADPQGPMVQPPPVPGHDMRARGAAVEAAAGRHLAEAGLRPVATNAAARFGELDLVMRDGQTLVFVEVRYRRSDRFGGGAASVDARKRRRLVLAAR